MKPLTRKVESYLVSIFLNDLDKLFHDADVSGI
jgi:hypothetical protein